jgi:hypothetical protein
MPPFLQRWRDECGDVHVLGAVRVALGLLLVANALRAVRELTTDYFGEGFHWPLVPEAFVPSRAVYTVIVGVQLVLAIAVVSGPRARDALLASSLLGTYVLLCNRLEYHHNRWALFCYAALLSFAPCDRSFRLRASGPRVGPLWAARLAGLQVSIVYLASGGSKLLDPDWRGGRVLLERFRIYGPQALEAGIPGWIVERLSQPGVTAVLAALAIATELFLAVGLWSRRTRVFALWWGVWFHFAIEATSRVEGFTWLTLAVYALFVTPDARARRLFFDPASARGRWTARAVGRLDWFARFDVAPQVSEFAPHPVFVVLRDGTRVTGAAALAAIARCVPLLFPAWLPLALIARFTSSPKAL